MLSSASEEENTRTYLKLAENPQVDVIGHCANVKFPFDYETGLKKFKENEKLVEINESTIKWKHTEKNYTEIIRICKKYEIPVILNSDAHFMNAVGDFANSLRLLEDADFPERLVFNADPDRVKEYLNRKHGEIF